MAYINQPWFNREIVNRFTMATGAVHSQILTVTTRVTKQPQKIPVTPVDIDGLKYLVSSRGEAHWVKNLRADPRLTLTTKSGATEYIATEKPIENRKPIIDAYQEKAGKIVARYFRKLPYPADSHEEARSQAASCS